MQSCCLFSGLYWNRLLFVTVLGIKKSLKIQKMLRFFVLLPDDVTQISLFQKKLSEQRKCLEKICQYGLFWFDRFCLLFCILSFTSF